MKGGNKTLNFVQANKHFRNLPTVESRVEEDSSEIEPTTTTVLCCVLYVCIGAFSFGICKRRGSGILVVKKE